MSYYYLPQPPRVWSRVQNSCSLITDTNNYELVIDPYTGELVTPSVLAERIAMLNKGNVLQYKANSSNLTKSQKYSKIARGQWVNRNTTWATQSTRGYTNPNTTSLKRDGSINIAIVPITGAIIGPTAAPPTCPQPFIPDNPVLPSNGGGGSDVKEPDIPPPVEPTPGSNVFPVIIPDTPVEPIVIQDEGSLICSVQENICTGETKSTLAQQLCYPTTDSDVPGPIQDLCWNDGTQTWYPRQRYVMTNSTDKWPINYKFLVSAYTPTPPILDASSNCTTIFLNWTQSIYCYSITSYEIYINNSFYKSVSPNTFKYDLNVENGIYDIFIIAKSDNILSNPSNTIIATIQPSITILGFSNIKKTVYKSPGYTTIVIETTIQPSFNVNGVGIASAYICGNIPKINLLIIGGGGGGASGYNNYAGGAGGGSGAINLITDLVISSFTTVNINVGSGGGGRTPGNGGGGNSSGQSGNTSSFSFNSTTFQSTYGNGALGVGSTLGGGGTGGNATNINGLGNYSGYGGSGGGGAYESGGGNVTKPGNSGSGYTSNGNIGSNGSNSNATGGNGGNSALQTITIPSLGTINIGGGGGGGGYYGGKAGNGLGGSGGTSTNSGSTSGQNATAYGAGGGGGGANSVNNKNTGGNGANGVIIIWY